MFNLSVHVTSSFFDTARLSALEDQWLNDSRESVIMPNVVLAINTLLGNEQDKLLVEQDSEGLRRLQDPTFRVSTRSREKIARLLSQMDGGSMAIAGPRGAGKSTLLKQFYQPSDKDLRSIRGLTIYVSAPSNYVARDFIAELFQQLCEGYLQHCEYAAQERLYSIGRSKASARLATRRVLAISLLLLRTILAILLVAWIASLFRKEFPSAISPASKFVDHWASLTWRFTQDSWTAYRPYFLLGVLIVALALLPSPRVWRCYLWWHKESELVRRSREYLLRLQIDKTVTRGTTITSPGIRGLVFGMNRASSAKYNPWTLPELVNYTRQFLYDLAQSIVGARLPVIVAIDEIDRIGSLEQAEAFIGDIKTIFGVEKCYFLVAVAEDVGSLFAQRATAGRSILENAFDEIVVAGPLELEEARDLLLKRVPGFTDAFAYLVYALSGGLPRELIRITRRLVEINLDQTDAERYPRRLPDLALSLAKEGMIETLDASRNQLSRLGLQAGWAWCFDNIRSVSIILRSKSSDPDKLYRVMEDISKLSPPKRNECADGTSMSPEDEDAGLRIISRLSAYAYFSVTIVDAFSDSNFDLTEAKRRTVAGIDGSYEQLAVARVELSAFADSARMILDRFRDSLSLERISSR
jgi:Cdc6-like AAA superfamily ATPase